MYKTQCALLVRRGESVYHNSVDIRYREPQGAVAVNTQIVLRIDAPLGAEDFTAKLCLQDESGQRLLPMEKEGSSACITITASDKACLMQYSFLCYAFGRWYWVGAESGEGRVMDVQHAAWQITVYQADFTTPDWFCGAVAYQIFPDRFYCSDPKAIPARAQEHLRKKRHLRLHTSWDEEPYWQPEAGRREYAPDDYFGGDFNGIRQKLPYLKALGVSCIYLNPIFEAASNHRYNTADYDRIDPFLGTNEDFLALAEDAKASGIRLILDGVFNHTGSDSIYFDSEHSYGNGACDSKDSPYYPWYRFTHWPNGYESWWGFPTLPNVSELEPSFDAFLNGEDGVVARWLRRGASGWRLDVADELPDDCIRHIRARTKAEKPDALLMGEVWEDCSNKYGSEGRRAYVNGDLLDCAMNYPFRDALLDFLLCRDDAYRLNERFSQLREHYPKPFYDASLNLISSHDEVRFLSALCGAPDRHQKRELHAAFDPPKEVRATAREKFVLATALQMTMPGVPCVYYGDEVGLDGCADPFNRRTYPWGREDQQLKEEFTALIAARNQSAALRKGYARFGALSRDVFALIRFLEKETSILLINRADAARLALLYPTLLSEGPDVRRELQFAGKYQLRKGPFAAEETEKMTLDAVLSYELPPRSYLLLTRETEA